MNNLRVFENLEKFEEEKSNKKLIKPSVSYIINEDLLKYLRYLATKAVMSDGTIQKFKIEDGILNSYSFDGVDIDFESIKEFTVGEDVTKIEYGALNDMYNLEKLIIGDNVTEIEEGALANYELKEVILGNSISEIGYYMFGECQNLRKITIPNSVTSIGEGAFNMCACLTDINIPNSVVEIGNGVFEFSGLNEITIPNSVTILGDDGYDGVFGYCGNLTKVTLSENINILPSGCFRSCDSLPSINLSNSITALGYGCFEECISLSSIILPENIDKIPEYCFSCCHSLTSINIPNSVSIIEYYGFFDCFGLSNIVFPNNLEMLGERSFGYCSNLTSLNLPSSLTYIDSDAFMGCYFRLNDITWKGHEINKENYSYDFYGAELVDEITNGICIRYDSDEGESEENRKIYKTVLGCRWNATNVVIPSDIYALGYECFGGPCQYRGGEISRHPNIISVVIPDSIFDISEGTFSYCTNLTSVSLPKGKYYYYDDNNEGETIYVPKEDVKFNDEYGYAYIIDGNEEFGVDRLTFRDISERMFSNCIRLNSITIPSGFSSIGSNAFYNCLSLSSVNIPKTVDYIYDNNNRYYSPFGKCYFKLNNINWEGHNVSDYLKNEYIGYDNGEDIYAKTFFGGAIIDENSTDELCIINNKVIKCRPNNADNIIIPNGVTGICSSAFCYNEYVYGSLDNNYPNLKNVRIPHSVTHIGGEAFVNCDNLKDIYYDGTIEEFNNITEDGWIIKVVSEKKMVMPGNVSVHCTNGTFMTELSIPNY